MKTLILAAIRCSLMFTAVTASLFSVRPAQAYLVTLEQVGSNVVANGSGAIDLTGPPVPITLSTISLIHANRGDISTGGSTGISSVNVYAAVLTGPTSFGSGGVFFPNAASGDFVGITQEQGGLLFVPPGYVSRCCSIG